MIIRKLRATFGTLHADEIELNEGLNIIEAPNESGKSTWCAFLRIMLYGFGGERDKAGFISDKTKFRPWDGAAPSGEMEITENGRSITLRRTGTAASPMKKFAAFYTDTGDDAGFIGADAGEALTGVSCGVFERTAFIRQAGVRVGAGSELEKKIAAMFSTGGEQISYADTEAKLRSWKNSLRHNKTGVLPRLEAEKSEAEARLSALSALSGDIAFYGGETERLEVECASLKSELALHDAFEMREKAQRIKEAENDLHTAEAELEKCRAESAKYSSASQERCDEVKASQAALNAVRPVCVRAEESFAEAERRLTEAENARSDSAFYPRTAAEAAEAAEKAAALSDRAAEEKSRGANDRAAYKRVCIIAAAVAVCIAAAALLLRSAAMCIPLLAVIFGAAAFAVLKKPKGGDGADGELSALLAAEGFESVEALSAEAEKYAALCRRAESERKLADAAEENLRTAEKAETEATTRFENAVRNAFPHLETTENIRDELKAADASRARISYAENRCESAEKVLAAVSEGFSQDAEKLIPEDIVCPVGTRADAAAALENAEKRLAEAKSAFDSKSGEASAIGAPELISGEIARLSAEIAENEEKLAAVNTALEVLADADTEIRTRFSPVINRRAEELLKRLTDGKYEGLYFDREFAADLRAAGDTAGHSALFASAGTFDQIYLALRLAMCEMLLPDGKCPVILDDALCSFDDGRTAAALSLLLDISRERQVLLFTCHSREARLLASESGVSIIKL